MAESSSNDTDVFVYTEWAVVPEDVVRVSMHPSVTRISEEAFYKRKKLEVVEFCEGLLEIGKKAFMECEALKRITIPSTVTLIGEWAFADCICLLDLELFTGLREIRRMAFCCCLCLKRICLPNSVERIGEDAFLACKATNFRVPPLISTIFERTFIQSDLFSIEMPEGITEVRFAAFLGCRVEDVIPFPVFDRCTDLQQLFGSETNIINSLKHRFDNLPIHKMIYYQSYDPVSVDQMNNATDISKRGSKLNPTGIQQDCLGMTPLHILACSTVPSIDLYKVLVNKYPETLITKDRWGALPLLYAVLRNIPTKNTQSEIVQFLVESYKSLYPNHQFNWNEMVLNLARFEALALRRKVSHD